MRKINSFQIFKKPDSSKVEYLTFDFLSYGIELEKAVNTFTIHKGRASFHNMCKDQNSLIDEDYEVLLNINRESDGVEDDLIFYERWLVNSDRDNKKRRNIFR